MRLVKPKTFLVTIYSLSVTCFLFGCAQPPPKKIPEKPPIEIPKDQIGKIVFLDGDDITVDGLPAEPNMDIYENQEVKTGPGSEVRIEFNIGGIMHLYGDTDPIFEIIREPLCLMIKMFRGHGLLDTAHECFKTKTPGGVEGSPGSKIAIEIKEGRTTYKVFEGHIDVSAKGKGETITVPEKYFIVVSSEGIETPREMTPDEQADLCYRFRDLSPESRRPTLPCPPSPPSKIKIRSL